MNTAKEIWRCTIQRRGFTLIELLVVLTILATLMTIVAPRYFQSVDQSREVALKQTLLVTRDAIDKYAADTGAYPASLAQLVEKRYLKALPFDPISERSDSWVITPPPDPNATGVYDLHSGAPGNSSNGTPFRDL